MYNFLDDTNMKIMKYNLLVSVVVMSLFSACSDDIVMDESLKEVGYKLVQGEPGSLDAMIYDVYERYGTYVLYDFAEQDIHQEWKTKWNKWYSPVKKGNEEYAKKMLAFVQKEILDGYTDDFVRTNLVYRIFLVDSLCKSYEYAKDDLVNVLNKEHGWVISNVGSSLDNWEKSDWINLKNELTSIFTLSFYEAASVKPTQFIALRKQGFSIGKIVKDPEEQYDDYQYTFYKEGYVRWKTLPHGRPNSLIPEIEQDFADYITFLTTTSATELLNVCDRFERMRERVKVFVPYLNDVLKLDVVATQNKNCPDDPVVSDFFSKL